MPKHFTRRHYIQIAQLLAKAADERKDLFSRADLAELVDRFETLFADDNPSFKPEVFRKAVWRDGQ
jgi:hypothetical protein